LLDAIQDPETWKRLFFAVFPNQQPFSFHPLSIHPIELSRFDTGSELWYRRAIGPNGATFDEPSDLVQAFLDHERAVGASYAVLHLRELGRTSGSVMGALTEFVHHGRVLVNGHSVSLARLAVVTDSNYADSEKHYAQTPLDAAVAARFGFNIRVAYLDQDQESAILKRLVPDAGDAIATATRLGQTIRRHLADGALASVPPPTISRYVSFLRLLALFAMEPRDAALRTLLGNATQDDEKDVEAVLSEVFGLSATSERDDRAGASL
jgi:MoxR-like ATPase